MNLYAKDMNIYKKLIDILMLTACLVHIDLDFKDQIAELCIKFMF